MLKQKNYKFWFCTGSQDLYGDECLAHVAEHAQKIVMTPAHSSSVFASLKVFLISSFVISVGFQTISYGRTPDAFSASTIFCACSAT